ncbi:MAG: CHAT domain-containing protein [Cyanobacteria bacterium P01_H01_bin.26]
MARVELILRKSVNTDQYDADLVVFDDLGNPSQVVDSLSPMPPQLSRAIDNWQRSFSQLVGTRRGTIKAGKTFSGNCSNSAEAVRTAFTQWLNSQDGWQRLQSYTQQAISHREEVQVNIQTIDERLRLLPWNEAFATKHQQVETSISIAREFRRKGNLRVKPQVRILAVLGSPGETRSAAELGPIDVNFDQQQLERTQARGAYIETLKQPSAQTLREALRDPDGWHIFFFAGHSKSQQDNSIGSVVLNSEEPPLGIDELKHELAIAIDNGLQLAIFNSCDGLGLASQLSELNLPQSIVMREPVPDDVAKDFLQQFLNAFSHNQSLFESVRRARQYLKEKWDVQNKYPGASWLPTIVRNPAVSLPRWSDFVAESPLSQRQLIPLVMAVLCMCAGLFVSLYFEFGQTTQFSEPSYLYYAKLYPHIVLYPWLFLWAAYYTLYKAWCQIRTRPKLWRQIAGCIALTIVMMGFELTSDNMMLFELQNGAEVRIAVSQTVLDDIQNIPASIIDPSTIISSDSRTVTIRKADLETALYGFTQLQSATTALTQEERSSYHRFMELGLSYSTWQGSGLFSVSRVFYSIVFIAIVAAVLTSAIFWREIGQRYVFNPTKYVRYIIATQLILVSWFLFRTYHNIETKGAIFGNLLPISGLDNIAYPVVLILLATSIYKSWQFEASYFAGVSSLIIVVGCILLGIQYPEIVGLLFGQQSDPRTWILWPLLSLLVLYMVYSDVFSAKAGQPR